MICRSPWRSRPRTCSTSSSGVPATQVALTRDPAQQRLVVRLHSLANPRSNAALATLCATLNALAVVYPGTNLRLVYEAPHVA